MPTFKHPCPHCGKYIQRDVAVCPFCGTRDPFAPARCPNCRTVIEDLSWTACPRCGQSLVKAEAKAAADQALNPPPAQPRPQPGPPPATPTPPPSVAPPQPATQPAISQAPSAPSQAQSPQPVKCTGCGGPLPAGAKFCTVCGTLTSV
jgi:RNA polymerase subunit RPABC4/transcription elongation factor Spt4